MAIFATVGFGSEKMPKAIFVLSVAVQVAAGNWSTALPGSSTVNIWI